LQTELIEEVELIEQTELLDAHASDIRHMCAELNKESLRASNKMNLGGLGGRSGSRRG
jgi:hypothetical protein